MALSTQLAVQNSPKSNGETERAVQSVKRLLKKANDPYMALLTYCTTLLANGYSPAELLMSRCLRTDFTATNAHIMPSAPKYLKVKAKEQEKQRKQKDVLDKCHAVQELDPLLPGEQVWIPDHNSTGTVVKPDLIMCLYLLAFSEETMYTNISYPRTIVKLIGAAMFLTHQKNDPQMIILEGEMWWWI